MYTIGLVGLPLRKHLECSFYSLTFYVSLHVGSVEFPPMPAIQLSSWFKSVPWGTLSPPTFSLVPQFSSSLRSFLAITMGRLSEGEKTQPIELFLLRIEFRESFEIRMNKRRKKKSSPQEAKNTSHFIRIGLQRVYDVNRNSAIDSEIQVLSL